MKRQYAHLYLAAVVSLITFALYLPARQNGFVNWDDDIYVYQNTDIRALTVAFVTKAFSGYYEANWIPLSWISHALDYALWGLKPLGHHLTSIVLHAVNTFIVVWLIFNLLQARNILRQAVFPGEGEGRWFPRSLDDRAMLIAAGVAGTLFGLHPLHVESVAWISERKDLLYSLFYLLSIMSYVRYSLARELAHRESGAGTAVRFPVRSGHYLLTIALFVLSLLSKPMAVTLPMVLLLLDWYPLRRIGWGKRCAPVLAEKIPFLLLSVAAAVVAIMAQRSAGAMQSLAAVSVPARVLIACNSLLFYLWKMVVPHNLNPLYPHPGNVPLTSIKYLVSLASVVFISMACVYTARRQRIWLSVWGYYVIAVLPVLGIMQVGSQGMADRFTYLSSLGPFLLLGLASAWVWTRADGSVRWGRAVRRALVAAAAVLLASLSLLTVNQISVWRSSIDLWNHVIALEPSRVPLAYVNRGRAFYETGQDDRALSDFAAALSLETGYTVAPLVYTSRGTLLLERGDAAQALRDLNLAIELHPDYAPAYDNRGLAYVRTKQYEKAIEDFTRAIALDPADTVARLNRGNVFSETGSFDRALLDYGAVIALDPGNAPAYQSLGMVFKMQGRFDDALEAYTKAITLGPASAEAYNNRGVVYKHLGEPDMAIANYTRAIELNPAFSLAYCNRGIALGMLDENDRAIEDFTKAVSLQPDLVQAYVERGHLYRNKGDRMRARDDYRKACELGSQEGCAAVRMR